MPRLADGTYMLPSTVTRYNPDLDAFERVVSRRVPRQSEPRRVETREDLRDYEADKGLHEAYKQRQDLEKTHSWGKLVRMWVEAEDLDPKSKQRGEC